MFGTEKKEVKAEAQAKVDYNITVEAARALRRTEQFIRQVILYISSIFLQRRSEKNTLIRYGFPYLMTILKRSSIRSNPYSSNYLKIRFFTCY